MLVHRKSNSLILRLKDPTRVTDHIPKSRVVEHKGHQLTQVHFGLDEVRVLRNLGIKAPSPIEYHYPWRGKYKPFKHQLVTSAFFTLNNKSICLNDMGTAKTLSALWAADYLMDEGFINRGLIVCPRSTMHAVWEDELVKHFMFNRQCVVLRGSKERRLKLLEQDADFYIINHDGVKVIADALAERADIDLKIIDEAAVLRNAQSARYKVVRDLIRPTDWLWLLTGTPCPTAPTDAWALGRLLGNPNAPAYFTVFKNRTMVQLTPYKWAPKPDAYQQAYDILQPGIRFRKEDCLDLPPVTFQRLVCDMTQEQARHYQQMHKLLVMQARTGGPITAANAAVKLQKLLQVCTGVVYDNNGGAVTLDSTNRLKALEETVEAAAHKVIVFVPFKAALQHVAAHLRKRWTVEVVDGDVGDSERKRIFAAFQNEDDPRVLVAHPGTTAHGLTLTQADTTIWYAPIFSLEIFEQANNRMNRPGQKNNMTVVMIATTPLELGVYDALAGKAKIQDSVLNLYQQEVAA